MQKNRVTAFGLAFSFVVGSLGCTAAEDAQLDPVQPNVVVILIDDMGSSDLTQ